MANSKSLRTWTCVRKETTSDLTNINYEVRSGTLKVILPSSSTNNYFVALWIWCRHHHHYHRRRYNNPGRNGRAREVLPPAFPLDWSSSHHCCLASTKCRGGPPRLCSCHSQRSQRESSGERRCLYSRQPSAYQSSI